MYLATWRAFAVSTLFDVFAAPRPSSVSLNLPVVREGQRIPLHLNKSPVSLPHDNPTRSFWMHGAPDANPFAKEGSEGNLTSYADTVIIGAGITGIGMAYYLGKLANETGMHHSIVILEARDFCSGATGRNGGHLVPNAFDGFQTIADKYSVDEAIRSHLLENHTTESILSVLKSSGQETEVDLVGREHLNLFFSEKEERASKAHWAAAKNAGVDVGGVNFLSRHETQMKYGPFFSSVRTPGYNLWPLKLVTHYFRLVQAQGKSTVRLHTHTPVLSIDHANVISSRDGTTLGPRWILETPRGTVRAHNVIHATNGYAAHLLPFLAEANGREGIVPTRGQVLATRASVGTDKIPSAGMGANEGFEYWFPRPLNNASVETNPLIILGGGREAAGPNHELGVTDDSVINPLVSHRLKTFLPAVYPVGWFDINQKPEMEWTGIMGYTKSTDPFVGPVVDRSLGVSFEGQYISAGYTGHGMPRALGCAEALSQMLISEMTNKTWSRPEWFPEHLLTTSRWRL